MTSTTHSVTSPVTTPVTNPVILVTGSSKRIGAEIIRQAHAAGYQVIVHFHHSQQSAQHLVDELNHIRPHSAKMIQADLSIINHIANLSQFVDDCLQCFGRLDALVHNASRFYPTPVAHLTKHLSMDSLQTHHEVVGSLLTSWDELFLTNAKAPFFLTQAFLPHLQLSKGSVISLLDIHANSKPFTGYSIYTMAKSAQQAMVQSLALELAPDIRVNGVAPGANIFPDMASDQAINTEQQQRITQSIPMQRIGTPADIANAVMFLLQAQYITGQVVSVDGGRGLTLAGG